VILYMFFVFSMYMAYSTSNGCFDWLWIHGMQCNVMSCLFGILGKAGTCPDIIYDFMVKLCS
jgi:hypothetical protein